MDKKIFIIILTMTFLPCGIFARAEQKTQMELAAMLEQERQEYVNNGFAASAKGQIHEALSFFRKALQMGAGDAALYNEMGILYEKLTHLKDAERFYLMTIESDAGFLPAYMNLGYLYKALQQSDKALEFFKKRYELAFELDEWTRRAAQEIVLIDPSASSWIRQIDADKFEAVVLAKKHFRANMHSMPPEMLYDHGVRFYAQQDWENAYYAFKLASLKNPREKKYTVASLDVETKLPEHLKRIVSGEPLTR